MAWRLKAGLLDLELAPNHPSPRVLCGLEKSQLEMMPLKASQLAVVWQEERSLSQPGSGPVVSVDRRLFQTEPGLTVAEMKASHRLANKPCSSRGLQISPPRQAPCPKPHNLSIVRLGTKKFIGILTATKPVQLSIIHPGGEGADSRSGKSCTVTAQEKPQSVRQEVEPC